MGSFNVGCGMSNLTVHEDDEVGFILLTEKETFPTHVKRAPETRTGHLYATDLYDPYLPPVYGTYDDYGNIAALEESPTTQVIEAIFNRPALAVINAVGQDRGLYSTYGTIAPLYLPEATLAVLGNYHSTEAEEFAALGFTEAPAQAPYTSAYRYQDYEVRAQPAQNTGLPPEYKKFQWDIVRVSTGEVVLEDLLALNGLEELFSSFAVLTGLLPGFAQEDWAAVKELQRLHGMFFLKRIYGAVAEPILEEDWSPDRLVRWEARLEGALLDREQGMSYSAHEFELQRTVGMRGATWDKLKPLVGTGEYSEILRVLSVMGALNRMLMPSLNGEQFGNDGASRLLAEASMEILTERKARWGEE